MLLFKDTCNNQKMDIIHQLKNINTLNTRTLDLSSIDDACKFPSIGGYDDDTIYLCHECFSSDEKIKYDKYDVLVVDHDHACHNCSYHAAHQLKNKIISCLGNVFLGNNNINILNLKHSRIDDGDVMYLSQILEDNKKLTYLNLRSNGLSDVSAMHISKLLLNNTTLLRLNIGDNKIKISGIHNIMNALKINNTLKHLNISKFWIGYLLCYEIADMLNHNNSITSINISNNFIISQCEGIDGCSGFADEYADMDSDVDNNDLGIEDEYVDMNKNADMDSDVDNNDLGIEDEYVDMNKNTDMDSDVDNNDLGIEDEYVDMNKNTDMDSDVDNNDLGIEDEYVDMNNNTNMNNYDGIKYLFKSLCTNTSLMQLTLRFNNICDDDRDVAKCIKTLLKNNQTLQHLDLGFNMIRSHDVAHISKGLEKNKGLTYLNLMGNREISNDDDGIICLSQALTKNTSLVSLNLDGSYIRRQMPFLCQALAVNKNIESLYLSSTGIKVEEMKMLYRSIQNSTTIVDLDLSNNLMDDQCAVYIVKLLTTNKYITFINLSFNSFTFLGVKMICECMEHQYTLSRLNSDHYSTITNCLNYNVYKMQINEYIDRNDHNHTIKNKSLLYYVVN